MRPVSMQFSQIVANLIITIFELRSVHTREDTKPNLQFSMPERGEEVRLVFWHADWCFIWDRISIRKCAVYRRKWLESQITYQRSRHSYGEFASWFERCVTGKHLRSVVIWVAQFKLRIAMQTCVHTVQNTVIGMMRNSNDHSNCALCSHMWKQSLLNNAFNLIS